MKKWISLFMAILMVISFAGCNREEPVENTEPEVPEVSKPETSVVPESDEVQEKPVISSERKEVSSERFKNASEIVLSDSITVNGKPAEESGSVTVGGEIIYYHDIEKYPSGNLYGDGEKEDRHSEAEAAEHTLVTITKPGEYFIKGELKGQIAVDLGENAEKDPNAKVTLIFGGADITCEIAPAVIFYNVYECGKTEEVSQIADTSKAGANVVIADGSVSNINGANVAKIYKDNENEEKLHKYDAAFYSGMSININGETEGTGVLNINGENEGLGSEMHLTVNGGVLNIASEDDGINANEDDVSVITLNGGNVVVKGGLGREGDGIDSNGWLVINGGDLYASGNGRGADGGIDADMGICINGGSVAAFGGKNDIVRGECSQTFAQFTFADRKEAGTKIKFADAEGKGFETESDREFYSLVISSPEISEGKEYGLFADEILQEYTSDKDLFGALKDNFAEMFEMGKEFRENFDEKMKNPFAAPEGFDEWLGSAEDVPEDVREWLEKVSGSADEMGRFAGFVPGFYNENELGENKSYVSPESGTNLEPKEEPKDKTIFVLDKDTRYFSGIYDSEKATGKARVGFTVNGNDRMEDIFVGDLPGITSVECEANVPAEQIVFTVEYSGLSEEIEVKNSCLLSDGYDAVNKLFADLQPGSYRFTVSVSSENENYSGSSYFVFKIVD